MTQQSPHFRIPYRKGVACYRAGQYAEAEKLFRQSSRPDVACSAAYNLGNALAYQQKYKEAIEAYENVLKQWPDHTRAKENLELVKKMLEQQQAGGLKTRRIRKSSWIKISRTMAPTRGERAGFKKRITRREEQERISKKAKSGSRVKT